MPHHVSNAFQSAFNLPKNSTEDCSQPSGVDLSSTLTLSNIREELVRQEDSIIFNLIERAQYLRNAPTYDKNLLAIPGANCSLLEYLLRETEHLHAKVRRYTSPVEHPFYPEGLPQPILGSLEYPQVLVSGSEQININPLIWKMYFDDLLPKVAEPGDDGNYGSTACHDVACLQALSKRIHFGKFVAEAKFQQSPELYTPLILAQDKEGLMKTLTFEAVEARVVARVEHKAATFGQDIGEGDAGGGVGSGGRGGGSGASASERSYKVEPSMVAYLYNKWVMPLTKEVQVHYLLRRLGSQ